MGGFLATTEGMASLGQKQLTDRQDLGAVELQKMLRDSSDIGFRHDQSLAQIEMIRPAIPAWMEEPDNRSCFGINRRDISSLETVTFKTTARQIRGLCEALVFQGDDVIRFKGKERLGLWEQAILAQKPRSFAHGASQSYRTVLRHTRQAPLETSLQHPHEQFRSTEIGEFVTFIFV